MKKQNLNEELLQEGFKDSFSKSWQSVKHGISKLGRTQVGGKFLGKKAGIAAKKQMSSSQGRITKEINKQMGEQSKTLLKKFVANFKKKFPEFPNMKSKEEFQKAVDVSNGAIMIFYNTVKTATTLPENDPGYMPPILANSIIKYLRMWVEKLIDYDLAQVYQYMENKEAKTAILEADPKKKEQAPETVIDKSKGPLTGTENTHTKKVLKSKWLPTLLRLGGLAGLGWFFSARGVKDIIESVDTPEQLEKGISTAVQPGNGLTQTMQAVTGGKYETVGDFKQHLDTIGGGRGWQRGVEQIGSILNNADKAGLTVGQQQKVLESMIENSQDTEPIAKLFGKNNSFFKQTVEKVLNIKSNITDAYGNIPGMPFGVTLGAVLQTIKVAGYAAKVGGATGVTTGASLVSPMLGWLGLGSFVAGAALLELREHGLKKSRFQKLDALLKKLQYLPVKDSVLSDPSKTDKKFQEQVQEAEKKGEEPPYADPSGVANTIKTIGTGGKGDVLISEPEPEAPSVETGQGGNIPPAQAQVQKQAKPQSDGKRKAQFAYNAIKKLFQKVVAVSDSLKAVDIQQQQQQPANQQQQQQQPANANANANANKQQQQPVNANANQQQQQPANANANANVNQQQQQQQQQTTSTAKKPVRKSVKSKKMENVVRDIVNNYIEEANTNINKNLNIALKKKYNIPPNVTISYIQLITRLSKTVDYIIKNAGIFKNTKPEIVQSVSDINKFATQLGGFGEFLSVNDANNVDEISRFANHMQGAIQILYKQPIGQKNELLTDLINSYKLNESTNIMLEDENTDITKKMKIFKQLISQIGYLGILLKSFVQGKELDQTKQQSTEENPEEKKQESNKKDYITSAHDQEVSVKRFDALDKVKNKYSGSVFVDKRDGTAWIRSDIFNFNITVDNMDILTEKVKDAFDIVVRGKKVEGKNPTVLIKKFAILAGKEFRKVERKGQIIFDYDYISERERSKQKNKENKETQKTQNPNGGK